MRLRSVAASAALVLCAMTGAVACSSSEAPDDARPTGPGASASPDCTDSASELPEECEVPGLSSVEIEQGEPATGAPATPGQ